jgi:putative DNA primase/helicase
VPLLRYDEPRELSLRAVQIIQADGNKRFTRGFAKAGCCLRLGHVVVDEPIMVCEGYATGLSLRMAVDRRLPVVVALDAGNLLPVAQLLRTLHPQCRLLICADDDWHTPGNPGRTKAHQAGRAVESCAYTWPVFRSGNRGPKDTDFNDLHAREGLQVLRRQLRHVLPLLGSGVLNAAA